VERGFSIRNATLKDNISEISIDAKRVIIDHMLSNDLQSETIAISTPLRWIHYNQNAVFIKNLKNIEFSKNE